MKLLAGGCSFSVSSSLVEEANVNPHSWTHHLINYYNINRFANMSIPAGGNSALVNNLIYYLETKPDWNPSTTLVGFNITELHRLDVMCPVDHPNHNTNFSWDHDLRHGIITLGPFTSTATPFNGLMQKHMGWDQVIKLNCLELVKLFTYLEHRRFSYFYMLIDDTVLEDSPDWFKKVLEKYKHRQALSSGMAEFAREHNEVNDDNWHPSKYGQELIAKEIITFIDQHELTKNII
jgi:hypothetical protein